MVSSRKPINSEPPERERRDSIRVSLDTDVTFASSSNFYTGFGQDISEGGIFVASYDLRPIGTKVEVKFTLPSGYVIDARGVVRWLRDSFDVENWDDNSEEAPPGMGIMFENLSEDDKTQIEQFLSARMPLFYDD